MSGGLFHGFQLWVNLPRDKKWAAAALPGHPRRQGRRCWPPTDGGALVRVIAGSLPGVDAGRPGLDVHTDHARPRDACSRAPS